MKNILLHRMKFNTWTFFAFSLIVASAALAVTQFPRYVGFVNDYAGILDQPTAQKIESLCRELEVKTGAEMAVAIVKTVDPLDPKTYAVELFQNWKIGKKGKDNGILILLTMKERRVEIEVGYGLEGVINDARAGQILDEYVIPSFKQGKYGEGLYLGAAAIARRIMGEGSGEAGSSGAAGEDDFEMMLTIFIVAFVVLTSLSVLASGPVSGLIGALTGAMIGFVWAGIAGLIIGAIIGFVLSFTKFPTSRIGGGGWGSGFGGGGSGGGGGGGFGGGSSGGGGAGRGF